MSNTLERAADSVPISAEIVEKEKLIIKIVRLTQFLTWPILFVLFHAIFEVRVQGRENLRKLNSPFVVIANHISFYDSFIFRIVFGLFTHLLPLRFMAVRKFNSKYLNLLASIGFVGLVYKLFGVFTVVPGRGLLENLKEARNIIEAGGNIVIYPEGKIVYDGTVGPFKPGASILISQTGVPALPVAFKKSGTNFFNKVLSINIGTPIQFDDHIPADNITNQLHEDVEHLYLNIK